MALLQEIKVPLLSVNDTTLTISDLLFAHGAAVKIGEVVMVFETSKTTYDVLAEADGFISYQCNVGEDYELNTLVASIVSESSEVMANPQSVNKKKSSGNKKTLKNAAPIWEGDTLFTPEAIALIESRGLERSIFAGLEMVSRRDVEKELGISSNKSFGQKKSTANDALIPVDLEKVTVKKISGNKRKEIEYLSQVQSSGLTSTLHTYIDTDGIFAHINQHSQYFKNALLPLIIFEVARLLLKYKELNAYFTGDSIAYYKTVNIGFAIDLDKGLKVLKVANADTKFINEIENDILVLSNRYLDDQLKVEDLTDISFTITDLSNEGVTFFKPLVNAMNSSILGISSIDKRFNRCTISLTFDHRVTEGKQIALFLQELKNRIESYQSKYVDVNIEVSCFKCMKSLNEDLSDTGFAKCITPKGEEAYICQSCFKGF